MGLGLSGRVEWKLIDPATGITTAEGAQDNIIFDLGRKYFLGGFLQGSAAPILIVASGTAEPAYTDIEADTLIAWNPTMPAGSAATGVSYTAPTVTYTVSTFAAPGEDRIINKVGLARSGSVASGSTPGTCTKPYCMVKLSSPISWPSTNLLDITYQITIEKYAEE